MSSNASPSPPTIPCGPCPASSSRPTPRASAPISTIAATRSCSRTAAASWVGSRSATSSTSPAGSEERPCPRPHVETDRHGHGRSSEPAGLVDDVAERLPTQEAAAVLEQDLVAAIVEIGAEARGVGRDEDAGHGPQGMVGGEGLALEDIEAGARDVARLDGRGEIVESGGHAAADVDEECRALHQLEA